jgi:hypothetical protein
MLMNLGNFKVVKCISWEFKDSGLVSRELSAVSHDPGDSFPTVHSVRFRGRPDVTVGTIFLALGPPVLAKLKYTSEQMIQHHKTSLVLSRPSPAVLSDDLQSPYLLPPRLFPTNLHVGDYVLSTASVFLEFSFGSL